MIMPTRYEFLVAVENRKGQLRQPVPERFLARQDEENADEYLEWLCAEAYAPAIRASVPEAGLSCVPHGPHIHRAPTGQAAAGLSPTAQRTI